MKPLPFNRAFLRLFSAPLIWAAHFVTVYGFVGVVCARRLQAAEWLGIGVATWGVAMATLAAIVAVLMLSIRSGRKQPPQDSRSFIRWTGSTLGMLSILAIGWEASSVLLVPACT